MSRRFKELEDQVNLIQIEYSGSQISYVDALEWRAWASSSMNLICAAFGENSPHYSNFCAVYKQCTGKEYEFKELKGIFFGAKADFDGGYVFQLETSITGEIFADFVVAAKQALAENQKDVAAVLACAALEDALKRFAHLNGLDVSDKSMQEVINALKAKGLVSGAQKSLLDPMPKIRDFAMHANWEKIRAEDIGGVIGFVENFLLNNF